MKPSAVKTSAVKISAVVAMSENRVIGKGGQLPWRLPEDLKRFRILTTGHTVIMGRKTFESIGRPLPNRKNVVISRQPGFHSEGVVVVHSLDEALQSCGQESEVFVIGGGEIYRAALQKIQRIYLTLVHSQIDGDAYFPEFDESLFREVSREDCFDSAENQENLKYSFIVLDRIPMASS